MSKSTVGLTARKRKSSSRKASSYSLFGGPALACLVLGCGWAVYSNILSASVYPTLGSAGYDEPVVRRSPAVATRSATQVVSDAFAALPGSAPVIEQPATVASIPPLMFNERFAAAGPQGVASAVPPEPVSAPSQQPPALKLAEAAKEAPRSTQDTSKEAQKTVSAPKLAEAPKLRQAAPAQVAMNVPPPAPRPSEPKKTAGKSMLDLAQRAKAAVMSIASGERASITEKLWGKQEQRGSLLSSRPPTPASPAASARSQIRRLAARRRTVATPRSTTSPRTRYICPTAASSKRIRASATSSTIRIRRTSECTA